MFHFDDVSFSVTSRRGARRDVFFGLDLTIQKGETVTVEGPNGSGKSSFLRMLLGQLKPTKGRLEVPDRSLLGKITYIPQDYRRALLPWLSIKRNISLNTGTKNGVTRCRDLLGDVGLRLDFQKYPYELSGGEQQLLLCCIALARNPHLLLLDEPTSAVDQTRKELTLDLLSSFFRSQNHTVVLVSHSNKELNLFSSQRIVFSGEKNTAVRVVGAGQCLD